MPLYVDMRAYLRTYSHVKHSEAALIAVVVSETIQIKDEGSQKPVPQTAAFSSYCVDLIHTSSWVMYGRALFVLFCASFLKCVWDQTGVKNRVFPHDTDQWLEHSSEHLQAKTQFEWHNGNDTSN